MSKAKVAIIGAGWSGLSAAVALADHANLTIFEAAREAGGRARRVNIDGRIVDNGQHILLGAYSNCLGLMRKIGVDIEQSFMRLPLVWSMKDGMYLRCRKLPAPLHFCFALLVASGVSFTEKWRLARSLQALISNNWQVKTDCSINDWLVKSKQDGVLRSDFWQPLVLSALNTSLEEASFATLNNVLADSLGGVRANSDFLLPRYNLSKIMVDPALAFLRGKKANICTSHRVRNLQAKGQGVLLDGEIFDALIISVAPYHLSAIISNEPSLSQVIAAQSFNPISTIYLQYESKPKLSLPISGLSDGTIHWLFDKEIISADEGMLSALVSCVPIKEIGNHKMLISRVIQDVQRMTKSKEQPVWARVINERRATFSAKVNRQLPELKLNNLPETYLAGDWTHAKYPATLEGAVQSGELAAKMLLERL